MNEDDVPQWLIPNKVYDVLKWVGLLVLPALSTFIGTVGPAWGLPYANQIIITINALGTLIGAVIGASAVKAQLAAARTAKDKTDNPAADA